MKGSILGRRFEYTLLRPSSQQQNYRSEWNDYKTCFQEMTNWCHDQKFDHWGTEGNTFWFYYERDYMLFMLRWS